MTQVRNAGHYLREQMSPWLIALLALITAVAFTTPFLFSERALGTHVSPTVRSRQPIMCDRSRHRRRLPIRAQAGTGSGRHHSVDGDGLTGSLVVDVRNTGDGQVFDFTVTGDFVVAGVVVKGGPNANFYDYTPDGTDADTGLHAPVGPNGRWSGLSHIEFCIAEAPQTGAIEVNKFAKVPGSSDTQPVAGAGFTLFDNGDAVTAEMTTDAEGVVCFDGLPVGTTFRLSETTTPSGYATVADQNVTSSATQSDCGDGNEASYGVENLALTDISIDVTAQIPGATLSTIVCG